jgi:hypothetical protein
MTGTTNVLGRLQEWYVAQCDGNWEHSFGVTIGTLDNSGWQVRLDLQEHRPQAAPLIASSGIGLTTTGSSAG